MFKKMIIPLLLIFFMASMVAFAVEDYGNVGPTTNFGYDIGISDEIIAEGSTVDGWETTVFFTDPTADRTITIPNYDVTVGSAILLTVTDNEATNENNAILFTSGGVEAGVLNIESDGGDFYYNPSDGSLHATLLYGDGTNITGVGAAAATALTISGKAAENIDKGEVVYISGATGPFAEFSLADNTDAAKHTFCGIAAETKTTGQVILIRVRGELAGFDTSAFSDGDVLYLSTAGALTNVKPTSGAVEIVGFVSYDHAAGSIVVMHHSAHGIHVPSTDDIVIRMGDSIAGNKVYFKDYANAEVAFIDSDGKADFTSLTLDTALLIAEGGTNSAAGLTDDRVMVSSAGAIIHSATITVTELGLLNGLTNTIVTDNNACTDLEGTKLSIGAGVLNCTETDSVVGAVTGIVLSDGGGNITASAVADTLVLYIDGATNIPSGEAGFTYIKGTDTLNVVNIVCTAISGTLTGTASVAATGDAAIDFFGAGVDAVTDTTTCTDIEGTLLSIGAGVLNAAIPEDHINATMLKDDNAPADEDIFCYELTGTTGHWYSRAEVGIGVATSITDGIIVEADLDADAVAVGDILTYDDGGVDFLWKTKAELSIASSGANIDITSILNAALYVGRDADNQISWATDDRLIIEIGNVIHTFIDIETGVGDNDSLVTQGYVDGVVGGANVSLSNLAAVAINASLISDTADAYDLGSATFEWLTLYLGTYGTIYFGVGQTENIAETAVNELTITSTTVIISGTLSMTTNNISTTGYIGRDADNFIDWTIDDSLTIEIGGVQRDIVSITGGVGDNDKLVTQGYVDDIVGGASLALDNLAVVAINTSLLSDAADTDSLGSATKEWLNLYVGDAGKIFLGLGQTVELFRSAANTLTITASTAVLLTGPLGVTGTRVSKGWFTDIESTNAPTVGGAQIDSDDLSDVASIAMLDENETVAGSWTYESFTVSKASDTPLVGSFVFFRRLRDGDPTSNVSSGDVMGSIIFQAFHTAYSSGANIRATVDGTPGNGDMPGRLEFYTTPDGSDTLALRMAIDNAGNTKMGDGVWTNYTNVDIAGNLTPVGTAIIDLNQSYLLMDDPLGTDHFYSGLVDSDTVGENVVFGDLLYFDYTDVEWKKAKADAIGTTPAMRIALETKGDGDACLMLIQGWIRDDSAFDFGASRIFLNDDVAGTCDDTAPAESGDQIQVVGIGTSTDTMYFCPSIDVGEI